MKKVKKRRKKARSRKANPSALDLLKVAALMANPKGKKTAKRSTKTRKRRPVKKRNPCGTKAKTKTRVRNPGVKIVGQIPGSISEIGYRRPAGKMGGRNTPGGHYVHRFGPGAKVYARSDGSLLIKGQKRLWQDIR